LNVIGEKEHDPDPLVKRYGSGSSDVTDPENCQFEVPYINTIVLSTGTVQHNTLALYNLLLTKSHVIFSLLFRLLLAVNAQSSSGDTPLKYACAGGHEDVSTTLPDKQCCGSGMFIPDPGSRIPDPKTAGVKK
jgi:hypothetical protein